MYDSNSTVGKVNQKETRVFRVLQVNPDVFESPDLLPGSVTLYWSSTDGTEILGKDITAELFARGPERYQKIEQKSTELFSNLDGNGKDLPSPLNNLFPALFGGFSFFDEPSQDDIWNGFPPAYFFLPTILLIRKRDACYAIVTSGKENIDCLEKKLRSVSDEVDNRSRKKRKLAFPEIKGQQLIPAKSNWSRDVEKIISEIQENKLKKAVLTRKRIIQFAEPLHVNHILPRLSGIDPSSVRFLFQPGESGIFAGVSPEKLISLEGNTFYTESLAGTARTADDRHQNKTLAEKLTRNAKNQNEHSLVVKDIQKRLKPYAASISVEEQTVRSFPGVQHLCTPISGRLENNTHILSLVAQLHPTPAVGGVPRTRAVKTIQNLEPFSRGWYTGTVGWFNRNGDGNFSVAIRSSAVLDDCAHLFAGAGIVEGSSPEKEWNEIRWKFGTMMKLVNPSS